MAPIIFMWCYSFQVIFWRKIVCSLPHPPITVLLSVKALANTLPDATTQLSGSVHPFNNVVRHPSQTWLPMVTGQAGFITLPEKSMISWWSLSMIRLSQEERNSSPMVIFSSQMMVVPAVVRKRLPRRRVPFFRLPEPNRVRGRLCRKSWPFHLWKVWSSGSESGRLRICRSLS